VGSSPAREFTNEPIALLTSLTEPNEVETLTVVDCVEVADRASNTLTYRVRVVLA